MSISQAFKMAMKSVLSNKMRSLLTMLGIIIGVTSVIALVSVGQGTTKSVTEQVESLGTNLLTVNITGRGNSNSIDYEQTLSLSDIEGVQYVAPVSNANSTVKYAAADVSVSVTGTNADFVQVRGYTLASGRFISQIDLDFYTKVAVLGATTAEELFGFADPVGEYVQINGARHKVVGVLEAKGDSSTGSNDELVVIPLSSAERLFKTQGVRTVYVQVEQSDEIDQVSADLESTLAEMFRGNADSFRVFNQQDMLETVSSISDTLSLALGGIAGISLLVGGIGIMNIMLVSVTERTREIGIRKAIGAKKRDILIQFLIESVVLSGLGGIIGVAAGIGASRLVSAAFELETVFSPAITLLAFGFSMAIGIVFGLFPANKAAKLKPIEALRFD